MSPPAVEFPTPTTPTQVRATTDVTKQNVVKQDMPPQKTEGKSAPAPKTESSTQLAYSLDRESNTLSVKITDQLSGDVLRTLEFKGFTPEAHDLKAKGHLFDGQS